MLTLNHILESSLYQFCINFCNGCSRGRQKEKQGKRNESASLADQRRTLPEWNNLARAVLVLKCNEYNLVTKGSQKQMAERLHNHFQAIKNNELLNESLESIAQEDQDDQTLPINNDSAPNLQQSTTPSVSEFASSLQSLTEIVIDLANAWEKTGVEKESSAKRKRTVSVSSSTSSSETDGSESDSSSDESSSEDDAQVEGNTTAASSKKSMHDRRTVKNHGHNDRSDHSSSHKSKRRKNSRSKSKLYDFSSEEDADGLPTLPQQTLKKIKACEFVNFNSLLSSILFSPENDDLDNLKYDTNFSNKKGLSLKASNPTKCKVCDLPSFMEAWNAFLKATLYYDTDMLDELLGYQKLICDLSARYKPSAWIAYDKEHRQACTINHRLRWDKRNSDAVQRHVEGNSLLTCFACKRVGHCFSEFPGKDKESSFDVGQRFVSPQQQVHNVSNFSPSPSP